MKTEIRARASLERRALTEAEKSAGYIGALTGRIPFNSDSGIMRRGNRPRPFVERLAPEVFKRSLAEDKDIMVNAGHTEDPLSALARIGENLTIVVDERSLDYTALLPDTKAARDTLTLVDKKIIRGTSFEFSLLPDGETWEKRDDSTDLRTITAARLHALNPVIWPAYSDTQLTVELRRRDFTGPEIEARGTYAIPGSPDLCDWYDPTLTPDTKFACGALSRATWALTDALEYLRAAPAGGMAEFARALVAASAAEVKTLAEWLAANGATVNPASLKRARDLEAEARSALKPTETAVVRPIFPGLRIFS